MECGIVGLPNVGKSTLFNALTKTSMAQAANYPFCTIDPNVGSVMVPDNRLEDLKNKMNSQTIIPAKLHFVDIAGLVKGASQGEGLGNQFLSHIRKVDIILHVVRCFKGEVIHVNGSVDPVRDMETVETELMLADLQSVEKRLSQRKKVKNIQEDVSPLLEKAESVLSKGQFASCAPWTPEEKKQFPLLALLTLKPMVYVCNVSEEDVRHLEKSEALACVKAYAKDRPVLSISSQLESEISVLSPENQRELLEIMGLKETGLSRIIRTCYDCLGLRTFFTVGPKEARAWTIPAGSTALEAAGVIHTDFQKGFIRAEVVGYQDYVSYPSFADIKSSGKVRSEGKEYIMEDGDVVLFRFNC